MNIDKIKKFARKHLEKNDFIHGWGHTKRVSKLSKKLGREEGADLKILEVAALLHDIGIHKNRKNHEKISAEMARNFLENFGKREEVVDCIESHRFSKGESPGTLEAKILQDADMLDAIGAVGIIRAAYFSGYNSRPIFDSVKKSLEEDKGRYESMIDHFNVKLLKIKERLNTTTAREIAQKRHEFMESFLDQFFKEWNVENSF